MCDVYYYYNGGNGFVFVEEDIVFDVWCFVSINCCGKVGGIGDVINVVSGEIKFIGEEVSIIFIYFLNVLEILGSILIGVDGLIGSGVCRIGFYNIIEVDVGCNLYLISGSVSFVVILV